ncbi:hypothetical protein HOLleu_05702 [Holothuria leucospilota]|uniref:Uncharacterized protein n=1 Tax=Holothuria leucospilota TaxID=206669 RepID=A0A9Q1HIF6_HOLLE|nr:hypothetical protein HOLleu_05702 [Holothuria leucospilota]
MAKVSRQLTLNLILLVCLCGTASAQFASYVLCNFQGQIEEDFEGEVGDIAVSMEIDGDPMFYEPHQFYQ